MIGYENRALANEDFNDDKKDAGELGSGHTVTALYEIIPAGDKDTLIKDVDDLKYQSTRQTNYDGTELMNIKLRYKEPESDSSKLLIYPVEDENTSWENASDNFRLSAAVAEFGLLLRESSYKQNSSFEQALVLAEGTEQNDNNGYRSEFVKLVKDARQLEKNN